MTVLVPELQYLHNILNDIKPSPSLDYKKPHILAHNQKYKSHLKKLWDMLKPSGIENLKKINNTKFILRTIYCVPLSKNKCY